MLRSVPAMRKGDEGAEVRPTAVAAQCGSTRRVCSRRSERRPDESLDQLDGTLLDRRRRALRRGDDGELAQKARLYDGACVEQARGFGAVERAARQDRVAV